MHATETSGLSQYQQPMHQTGVVYPGLWIDRTVPDPTVPIQFILPVNRAIDTLIEETGNQQEKGNP